MAGNPQFDIASLGYMLVNSDELESWRSFAGSGLGMQEVDSSTKSLAFRMDDFSQRLMITKSSKGPLYTIGWQAASALALDRIADRLQKAGVEVVSGQSTLAEQRMVKDLIVFDDPAGNRIEIFHDPTLVNTPFESGRTHSGFRTGSLGLGHVVLITPNVKEMKNFYDKLLGFRLSDYMYNPFHAYFFHINKRHHSLAVIENEQSGIHHLMIEYTMFDDIGQGYDVLVDHDHKIGVTLGRHTNDFMTSFYVNTPSAFMVECGWGGREIDPANWQSVELTDGASLWGHDRSWLSPERFEQARQMRISAAAKGMRAPVNVLPGNYVEMNDTDY
jgi:2,3-dihydroxybiphenyl 1,2-dioxygenase